MATTIDKQTHSPKEVSSEEVQKIMFERRLKEREWNRGLSTIDILNLVNTPRTQKRQCP